MTQHRPLKPLSFACYRPILILILLNTLAGCGSDSKTDAGESCSPATCQTLPGVQKSHCDGKQCVIDACKTGFHLENNACEPDDEETCLPSRCSAKTGVEKSHCDGDRCIIDRCLSGYRLTDNTCVEVVEKVCYPTECYMTPHAARSHCEDDTCVITECEIGYHIFGETCEPDSLENCGQHGTTCEDECFHGQCRDTCEEDGETRCRMIIENNPVTGLHNLAVFKKSSCLNTHWQNEQPCPEGYICDADGKDCIDPNDISWFQTMCDEAYHLLECIQYQGITYNALCYTKIEDVTACVGDTPNCYWNDGCYDVPACNGNGKLQNGHGGCKCDYGYTYDVHQCYELCDSSGSFGLCVSKQDMIENTYVGFCNDYTFDFIEDCGDMPCRGEDSYYYCTQECAKNETLCKQIYDAQKNPIYIELSCQNDRCFGGAKRCENGCSDDGKTCREL